MARGINKVILVGNLGNDPDVKYTQGGMAITKVSLATSSVRKDKDGNQQEKTEWHRVTFFGKLGEIAGEYLKKGSQVYGGRSRTANAGDDGQKRTSRHRRRRISCSAAAARAAAGCGGAVRGGGFQRGVRRRRQYGTAEDGRACGWTNA